MARYEAILIKQEDNEKYNIKVRFNAKHEDDAKFKMKKMFLNTGTRLLRLDEL